jgi:VWFA-related protein
MSHGRISLLVAASLLVIVGSRAVSQSPSSSPSQDRPRFPSGIELITVDVVVLDRAGNPVEGLTTRDFAVKENGQPQDVSTFEAVSLRESAPTAVRGRQRVSTNTDQSATAANWFFVVLDDVNISQYSTPRARDAMVQFVARALRPGDHVLMATSSGSAWWSGGLPEDSDSLVAFVNRFQGARRPDTSPARIWDHEAMGIALGRDKQALAQVARRYFETNIIPEAYPMDREYRQEVDVSPGIALIQTKARQVYREATDRLGMSLTTLNRISDAVAQMRGRKTVLLVSEGFIMDPSQTEFRTLVQSARNANAAVYFVDVRSPEGMVGQPGMAGGGAEFGAAVEDRDATTALAFASAESDGARSVAIDTGGKTLAGVKLVDDLTKVVNESRAYYLLGYTSTNKRRDGKFRRLEVVVNRPNVEVRARGGYYAPSDKEPPPPDSDRLDPAVRGALDAPFGVAGIPLRFTSYVFGPQADGKVQVMLLGEADVTPLHLQPQGGTYSATLDSYVVVHGRDSGERHGGERLVELNMPADVFELARRTGVPIRREFSLSPGGYQATLVLRDRATRLVGSVRHEFDVAPPTEFHASTPILTDVIEPPAPGQPPRPVPMARRTFRAGSRLFCAFDVYGASPDPARGGPRVSLGYALRRADGTEVRGAAPQPLKPGALGQVTVTIALTLPPEARGEHELRLTVRDEVSTRTLDIEEPLEIVSQ